LKINAAFLLSVAIVIYRIEGERAAGDCRS